MVDPKLRGEVVLVTGANHGIGAATARAFAAQGAKVFMAYYRGPCRYSDEELARARVAGIGGELLYRAGQRQSADPLVKEIRSAGGEAAAHEADLRDVANIPVLFDRCEAELGPVDVLVNNHTHCAADTFDPAGAGDGGGTPLATAESIDAHLAVNTRAYALLMAEYVRRYLARKACAGRIIVVSTDAAPAYGGLVSYAASKHAIESYSRSAAAELGKYGITVNIVSPGPTQTGWIGPEQESGIVAKTPLGRIGLPEDVADAIVFLASEQARWLTGQLLYIGGGYRMPQ